MRAKSAISIISDNKQKRDEKIRAKNFEESNKKKEVELENLKKEEELKNEERKIKKRQLDYLVEEKNKLLNAINELKNPVVISFSADESVAGSKYIELKSKVENTRQKLLESRTKVISFQYILLAKFSATLFFLFILIRLSAENIELIESFVFLTIFQSILGSNNMALFLDLFLQDIPLISAISFVIAIGFKDYKSFFEDKTRTNLYILFCISVIGLFLSSMLFSY